MARIVDEWRKGKSRRRVWVREYSQRLYDSSDNPRVTPVGMIVQGLTAAKIAPNSTIRVSVLSSDTQVLSSSLQLMMNREEALA